MNSWYWIAVVCAACFAVSWFMPAYITKEWGAVWPWEIKSGWNNLDDNGNPTHDDLGNQIKPNPVRKVALVIFGVSGAIFVVAGYFHNAKQRIEAEATPSKAEENASPPRPAPSP